MNKYFLITADFFYEWELIKAPNKIIAEEYILQGLEDIPDMSHLTNAIEIITSSEDTISLDDLIKKYNPEILYISDYESEE